MEALIGPVERFFADYPAMQPVAAVTVLLLAAFVANWLVKKIVVRLIKKAVSASKLRDESLHIGAMVTHLSNAVPALIIQQGVEVIPEIPDKAVTIVQNVMAAFIILTIARAVSDVLDLVNDTYEQRPDAASRPIKGYVQVGKILVYAGATIMMIAALIGQSPLLLLSGLGALAAVLMLVFRDTILSLVASVQLRSNDMLRVGDWIEMPQLNADGDVVDIALHTVKVQNFDKTITSIPTHRLISDSYRNWRSMREWGGRRIKRALYIDQTTIGFVSGDDWEEMRRFFLLRPYWERKEAELADWNAKVAAQGGCNVNKRRPTNIGTFRAYILAYLSAHPDVNPKGTKLVRQLDPGEKGLPLEIYCFTSTTAWPEYERIQSDIFDHLIAIAPEFGLRIFQHPSGHDLTLAMRDFAAREGAGGAETGETGTGAA